MERKPTSASWRGWLQGAGWTLALAALLVAAVGLVDLDGDPCGHRDGATRRPGKPPGRAPGGRNAHSSGVGLGMATGPGFWSDGEPHTSPLDGLRLRGSTAWGGRHDQGHQVGGTTPRGYGVAFHVLAFLICRVLRPGKFELGGPCGSSMTTSSSPVTASDLTPTGTWRS